MSEEAVAVATEAPILGPAPATLPNAPVLAASEQGEPTIEELAALVPKAEPVAAEPAAEPPAAEAEPVVAAKTEDAAAVDEALARAEKAAAKAREGSRRYAEQQRMLAEQHARVQQAAREAERLRHENEAHARRMAAFQADPYKALKDAGMTDVDLAQRALRENTPEAVTARLEQALMQERAERVALERRLESERVAQMQRQAEAKFVSIADDEAAYPRLSQLNADAQLDVATAALARIRANGYDTAYFTDAQVAEACEAYLAPKRAHKTEAKPAPKPVAKPVVKPTSGATLTNKQAQTRVVAPSAWDALSEEQQLAAIAASLPDPDGH